MSTLRILVVEDSEMLATSLCRFLGALGHSVTHAGNLREARSSLDEGAVNLVFADVQLPDGSGPEMLGYLPPNCAMVSMSALDLDCHTECDPRWVAHLVKPCPAEAFEAAISQAAGMLLRRPGDLLAASA